MILPCRLFHYSLAHGYAGSNRYILTFIAIKIFNGACIFWPRTFLFCRIHYMQVTCNLGLTKRVSSFHFFFLKEGSVRFIDLVLSSIHSKVGLNGPI